MLHPSPVEYALRKADRTQTPLAPLRIGYLEDDASFASLYQSVLSAAGYDCHGFGTVADFLPALRGDRFDLLLVDWLLPDGTAESVIDWVRRNKGWGIPILVASGLDAEHDIVRALSLGADDYVGKPVRVAELLARIATLTRRLRIDGGREPLRFPPYEVDMNRCRINCSGDAVDLTQKEFDLACFLFLNQGKLLSRVHLLERVWGRGADIGTRTVDAHISRLRKKLKLNSANGWEISSTYGSGYRLETVSGPKPAGTRLSR